MLVKVLEPVSANGGNIINVVHSRGSGGVKVCDPFAWVKLPRISPPGSTSASEPRSPTTKKRPSFACQAIPEASFSPSTGTRTGDATAVRRAGSTRTGAAREA